MDREEVEGEGPGKTHNSKEGEASREGCPSHKGRGASPGQLVEQVSQMLSQATSVSKFTPEDVSSLAGLFTEWQQKLKSQQNEVGYELLYCFLQYSKARKIQLLHDIRKNIQSLDEDISVVYSKLITDDVPEASGGEKGREAGCPMSNKQRMDNLHKKLFADLKDKEYVAQMFPKLEPLYKTFSGTKRKLGHECPHAAAMGSNAESQIWKRREKVMDKMANTLLDISNYRKLNLRAEIPVGDLFRKAAVISSIGFNEKGLFATAGVSRKIKVYEYDNVLDNKCHVPCPVLELTWRSKLSDLDWNLCEEGMIATSDYDGMVTIWDTEAGESVVEYDEHEKRAWSVCFNKSDSHLLASGSDDGTVKIYTTKQSRSILSIDTFANVCSVQHHPSNFHYVAVGCADHHAYVYDLRNTQTPVSVFFGHKKAVSYVAYNKENELLTASTDNTLKLWNILDSSPIRTLSGHANEKHFVGMSVQDDWVACGSEVNELYIYHTSLESPLVSYSFRCSEADDSSGNNAGISSGGNQFISAACWKPASKAVVTASSDGNVRLLSLGNDDP
mmetsp:Transcript_15357/g.39080  ORF Transcript_15357/g.39080 Transcript_15357/m.39080 type:complete len:559 (+) Transcript_15357:150-1826(+)|eukprot:CAMPEP_0198234678 /NCGR_PEP_ID=MMETSP1446-20131203/641_1 /TAXON_ID=1461542 ORGANISM="Unidentified sp, Strain CCMP2111" /NCGR_SAMPLE_ID=MMETSP1446 /ASSEMBLY_ACC=CAM_ASM_001112 /LENGTH=558 /DNA_ID=CAMNT_0043915497 /DNA_START=140 /DNA_END=1816 /DNA_ORIENTATION=-